MLPEQRRDAQCLSIYLRSCVVAEAPLSRNDDSLVLRTGVGPAFKGGSSCKTCDRYVLRKSDDRLVLQTGGGFSLALVLLLRRPVPAVRAASVRSAETPAHHVWGETPCNIFPLSVGRSSSGNPNARPSNAARPAHIRSCLVHQSPPRERQEISRVAFSARKALASCVAPFSSSLSLVAEGFSEG